LALTALSRISQRWREKTFDECRSRPKLERFAERDSSLLGRLKSVSASIGIDPKGLIISGPGSGRPRITGTSWIYCMAAVVLVLRKSFR
jgi:hypothetical protein